MSPIARIVVGYDGTDTAGRAAAEAAALARATGAELHVVRVVDDDRLRQGMISSGAQQQLQLDAEEEIQRLLTSGGSGLTQVVADSVVTTKVVAGSPAPRLIEYAEQVDADLIVVGNRRVQGIERVLGSVAIAVLRHAPCSVYVAHTS